jgi:hypothetical protein
MSPDARKVLPYYARSLEPPTQRARAWKEGDPERMEG